MEHLMVTITVSLAVCMKAHPKEMSRKYAAASEWCWQRVQRVRQVGWMIEGSIVFEVSV
jgi:hypothetical protein